MAVLTRPVTEDMDAGTDKAHSNAKRARTFGQLVVALIPSGLLCRDYRLPFCTFVYSATPYTPLA